jgi:hypothetical protein
MKLANCYSKHLFFSALLLVVVGCFLISCETSEVEGVKNGTLSAFPDITVGEAVDGFFGDPTWEVLIGDDGNTYVNVEGTIQYMSKDVQALIQFRLDVSNDTFKINALEFNGIPQSDAMLYALIEKMYTS